MSGFSDDVAMAVTHPACPAKEPKKRRDSAIVCEWVGEDLVDRRTPMTAIQFPTASTWEKSGLVELVLVTVQRTSTRSSPPSLRKWFSHLRSFMMIPLLPFISENFIVL